MADYPSFSDTTRVSKWIMLATAVLAVQACMLKSQSTSATSFESSTVKSLARDLARDNQLVSQNPVVRPSEVFEILGREPNGLVKQRAFTTAYFEPFLLMLNAEAVLGLVRRLGDPELSQSVASWARMPDSSSLKIILDKIIDALMLNLAKTKNYALLDDFPTIPLSKMPAIQHVLLNMGSYNDAPGAALPYEGEALGDWKDHIQLKEDVGCNPLKWDRQKVGNSEARLFTGMEPIRHKTVKCFAENSEHLATLFNQLTNTVYGKSVRAKLTGSDDKNYEVRSFQTLLDALSQQGFTIEIYTTRVLVDFFGLWFKDGEAYKSIRAATHIFAEVGQTQGVAVPAEHGELNLMLHKGGRRYAQLRWYFGVPEKSKPSTLWRPQLHLQAPWTAPDNESVLVLSPNEDSAMAVEWLKSTARVMRGFQHIQNLFAAPLNSYGLFICADSLIFAVSDQHTLGRKTQAFPILRGKKLAMAKAGMEVDLEEVFAQGSGIDVQRLQSTYPSDFSLTPQQMRIRVLDAFPQSLDWRLRDFPEFVETLTRLRN